MWAPPGVGCGRNKGRASFTAVTGSRDRNSMCTVTAEKGVRHLLLNCNLAWNV